MGVFLDVGLCNTYCVLRNKDDDSLCSQPMMAHVFQLIV